MSALMTQAQMDAQLERFGTHRIALVAELASEGPADGIGAQLLLAMGSRETELKNIVGDHGHGRGWIQIDDRFHREWLASHPGCRSGSWRPTSDSALPAGRVPTLTHATLFTIKSLRHAMQTARGHGLETKPSIVRFAVAAHNAGEGGAARGLAAGNVDARTAHGNYSKDVLHRKKLVANYLKRHPVAH